MVNKLSHLPEPPSRVSSVDFVVSIPQSKGSISSGWSKGLLNQFFVKEGWYSMRRTRRVKPSSTQRNEKNFIRGTTLFSWKKKKKRKRKNKWMDKWKTKRLQILRVTVSLCTMTPSMKILGTRNRPSRLYKARALSSLPSPNTKSLIWHLDLPLFDSVVATSSHENSCVAGLVFICAIQQGCIVPWIIKWSKHPIWVSWSLHIFLVILLWKKPCYLLFFSSSTSVF